MFACYFLLNTIFNVMTALDHQNTCNYSLSVIDYSNYIDSYDMGKNLHLFPKITFLLSELFWRVYCTNGLFEGAYVTA